MRSIPSIILVIHHSLDASKKGKAWGLRGMAVRRAGEKRLPQYWLAVQAFMYIIVSIFSHHYDSTKNPREQPRSWSMAECSWAVLRAMLVGKVELQLQSHLYFGMGLSNFGTCLRQSQPSFPRRPAKSMAQYSDAPPF